MGMFNRFSRRQTLKISLTLISGLITTSLFTFLSPKNKSTAQAIVVQQPDEFELQGEDIQINYSTSSSVPQLSYESSNISRSFSDGEIQSLTTEFGTVITVILSRPINPDIGGNTVKLSLVIPIVTLPVGSKGIPIQTQAIVTTQKTAGNIRIPLVGQIQSYRTVVLNGTARKS